MNRIKPSKISTLFVALGALTLAGCGGSAPTKSGGEQVVFVTSMDCNESKKMKSEECSAAIQEALKNHLAQAPTYKSLAACEKAEGGPKCESSGATSFRPRLMATAVSVAEVAAARTKGKPIPVTPLYATMAGEAGFRTLTKTVLKGDDDLILFSPRAVAVYSPFVNTKGKKK
jgi:uncharacterized protein YgiB involved in biofilm formation